MHVDDLSARTQDYLKALWGWAEHSQEPAPLGEIARRTGQKNSTASEAIKRLAADGLVSHEPYAGVRLTGQGHTLAGQMVRRHRLVETFLVTELDYTWDEVHEEAELLEHAVSDRFIARIDARLGRPARDPHGDPIPRPDGSVEEVSNLALADVSSGAVTVERVNDDDPELLRYLAERGVGPGTKVSVTAPAAAGILTVEVGGDVVALAESCLHDIKVSR